VLLTVLFIVYAVFSRKLARSSFTGPMMFTLAGLIAAVNFLDRGAPVEAFAMELRSSTVQALLEATLAVILFSDAALIDARAVRKDAFLSSRLLLIGLPLTMIVGTVAAVALLPGIGFWSAAIIAIVLAPTDAALGQAVVSNEKVPDLVRQGLGVEAGLNDGLVVPFLTIAVAGAASEMQTGAEIAELFVKEIGLAIVIGVTVGWLAAKAIRFTSERQWMGREGRQIVVVFLAILCFIVADQLHGSGFIAAFVGGVTFGAGTRRAYPEICHFSEGVGHLMTMLAFFVFGALILFPALEFVDWRTVLYAIVSLAFVRMIPVFISLIGTDLKFPTRVFIGWFGPRGLASLVFIGTVVLDAGVESTREIVTVGAVTVALSVLLHGVSAWPASNRYGAWYARTDEHVDIDMVESRDVEIMPGRRLDGRLGGPEMGGSDD
jgi:NhaP-type Na+/H+ or K+/H+ antiporter